MNSTDAGWQEIVGPAPKVILETLSALGDLQIITRAGGIVHEQFGAFPLIEQTEAALACMGLDHYTLLAADRVRRVVLNRLGGTTAQPQPRIDFLDDDNVPLISVMGDRDSEALQAVLDGFERRPIAAIDGPALPEAAPVEEDHASVAPLRAAARSGKRVTVEFQRPGVRSSWSGVVEGFKLGPRNVNIIQADFHLHLKGGTIEDWTPVEVAGGLVERHARDASGRELGLVLRGEAEAFA